MTKMADDIETRLFIDGKFVPASDGSTFPLSSPDGTSTPFRALPVSAATGGDVDAAVAAAARAFPSWSALSPTQRGAPLSALADLIGAEKGELARLEARSMGKPLAEFIDADAAAATFRLYGTGGVAWMGSKGTTSLNTPGFVNVTVRQPYGVVAVIIPWNVPLLFFAKKVAPALAAGNTVVVKSSERAPLTSAKLATLVNRAGFPPGVINILSGLGPVAGAAMSAHPHVRMLSFTGSVRAGRAIQAAAAASNMKAVVLELGGKSPALVFADADLAEAARATAYSVRTNAGQTCMQNSRIYVERAVADAFVDRLTAELGRVRAGDPLAEGTQMGPVVDAEQRARVMSYVDEGAKVARATIVPGCGGEREEEAAGSPSLVVRPTVFLDAPEDARVMREEVFGPVACVNVFDDEAEAVRRANDSDFGLYAAVFTRDVDRALRVMARLEAGTVGVNCTSPTTAVDMPFGGFKQSGLGREGLEHSLSNYLETKTALIRVKGL